MWLFCLACSHSFVLSPVSHHVIIISKSNLLSRSLLRFQYHNNGIVICSMCCCCVCSCPFLKRSPFLSLYCMHLTFGIPIHHCFVSITRILCYNADQIIQSVCFSISFGFEIMKIQRWSDYNELIFTSDKRFRNKETNILDSLLLLLMRLLLPLLFISQSQQSKGNVHTFKSKVL